MGKGPDNLFPISNLHGFCSNRSTQMLCNSVVHYGTHISLIYIILSNVLLFREVPYVTYGVPKPLRGTGKVSMGLCLCNYILIDSYMQLLNKTCIFTAAVLQSYYAHAIHFCLKCTPSSHEYIAFWTNKLVNKHAKGSLFPPLCPQHPRPYTTDKITRQ
jgi:hypothetical protein